VPPVPNQKRNGQRIVRQHAADELRHAIDDRTDVEDTSQRVDQAVEHVEVRHTLAQGSVAAALVFKAR